jgi:thiamine-phosphate pyrophosphorylase
MNRRVPRLHLIGPLVVEPDDYPPIAAAAVAGGCDAVHLRMPDGPTAETLRLARLIQQKAGGALVIVNDRLDVALLAGAGGVQLGERSFSVGDARRLVGPTTLIGRSVHDIDGARRAAEAGADYLLAGHVFATPSKDGEPGRGLDWLAELCASVLIPVIALGGITCVRIAAVLDAGAHGVALGRELLVSPDPRETARLAAAVINDH